MSFGRVYVGDGCRCEDSEAAYSESKARSDDDDDDRNYLGVQKKIFDYVTRYHKEQRL